MLSTRPDGSLRLADRSRCAIVERGVFVFRDGVRVKRRPSSKLISRIERRIAATSFVFLDKLPEGLEVPEAAFFGIGWTMSSDNARARQLSKIQTQLLRMSERQLARVSKMLSASIN